MKHAYFLSNQLRGVRYDASYKHLVPNVCDSVSYLHVVSLFSQNTHMRLMWASISPLPFTLYFSVV